MWQSHQTSVYYHWTVEPHVPMFYLDQPFNLSQTTPWTTRDDTNLASLYMWRNDDMPPKNTFQPSDTLATKNSRMASIRKKAVDILRRCFTNTIYRFPHHKSSCSLSWRIRKQRLWCRTTDMFNHAPGWIVISKLVAADIGLMALIPAVLLTALAFITVVLRLYSRACLSKKTMIEDYLVMISLVCSAENLIFYTNRRKGVVHNYDMPHRKRYAVPSITQQDRLTLTARQ